LDQNARITGSQAKEVLLDAGYFDDEVIAATLKRDISLLCPLGSEPTCRKTAGKLHKNLIQYDEQTDTYRCPAQQVLTRQSTVAGSAATRQHAVYASQSCADCLLRERCTTARVRKIKRYPEDVARQALCLVMAHPMAQRTFRQRKAMVEPVFATCCGINKNSIASAAVGWPLSGASSRYMRWHTTWLVQWPCSGPSVLVFTPLTSP